MSNAFSDDKCQKWGLQSIEKLPAHDQASAEVVDRNFRGKNRGN